jgi:hypothetical protein
LIEMLLPVGGALYSLAGISPCNDQ